MEGSRPRQHFLPKHLQWSQTEEAEVDLAITDKKCHIMTIKKLLQVTVHKSFTDDLMVASGYSLTYNLYVNNSCVHMVFNLHSHLIFPRVASFCFTDEDNAVTLGVADANVRIDVLALLKPADLWPGFSLETPCTVYEPAQERR